MTTTERQRQAKQGATVAYLHNARTKLSRTVSVPGDVVMQGDPAVEAYAAQFCGQDETFFCQGTIR